MKLFFSCIAAALLLFSVSKSNAQMPFKFGTWQSFSRVMDNREYPEINGRMVTVLWKEIEPSNNKWDWTIFNSRLADATTDGKAVTLLVYTKEDAPDWIFQNGVPKVIETDDRGKTVGYAPYYADEDYKSYFFRMIENVRKHIEGMESKVRNSIVGVEGCLGSTGDYISYRGNVPQQYFLSSSDFRNLYKEFTSKYYSEYKNTNPRIRLITNPHNHGQELNLWLLDACPGTWIKTGAAGKGYQLNEEKSKSLWLMDILNEKQPNGEYVRARSEFSGQVATTPWWKSSEPKNVFTIYCSEIHWGIDISNIRSEQAMNHNNDTAFRFFNKYAGEKDPTQSLYAMSALKDVLDAADANRFPASKYGTVTRNNQTRYQNIVKSYASYGALLQDPRAATLEELNNLGARGINDVGWDLFPGNYERFLNQINPNETSVGYWNIASSDPNTIYGRFGRGFEIKSNKTALYFNLDDRFLNNAPLNGAYAITIDVVYLDKGTGSFRLYYDSKNNANTASTTIKLTNTNKWKKATFKLNDAYFGNRGLNKSDFSIRNAGNSDVIFSIVELSRSTTKGNRRKGNHRREPDAAAISVVPNSTTELTVLPNPVQYQFNVQLKDQREIKTITITDLSGKTVYQKTINGSGVTISKSEIGNHAGTYLIKVTTDKDTYSSKIIVL